MMAVFAGLAALAAAHVWINILRVPWERPVGALFNAGPAVEAAIDINQWKIAPPTAATREPLVVQFQRPLDRALLMRMLTVADSSGKEISGQIALADDERRWEFRPDQPWAAGSLSLVADTALEDTTGNNIARPFEVDVFERVDDKSGPEFVRIPFSVPKK